MLTRLTDRIEEGTDGKQVKVVRYGMWGTNAEIERHSRKFEVVLKGEKLESFRTRQEAEQFMILLVTGRCAG